MFRNNRGWFLSLCSLQIPSPSLIKCFYKNETNLVMTIILIHNYIDGNSLVPSDLSSVHPKLLCNMHIITRFSFHWGSCNQIAFYNQFSFHFLFICRYYSVDNVLTI